MPTYSVSCSECGHSEDLRLTFAQYDEAKTEPLPCPKCSKGLTFDFAPGNVSFVMKDGPSGGWASKANKERKYRAARNKVLDQKTRDHVLTPKLQPNYNGEETGTWKEARQAAQVDGKAPETYDPYVAKEAVGK
jgi:predicted nucleic acid-binding Zn ribbon protein